MASVLALPQVSDLSRMFPGQGKKHGWALKALIYKSRDFWIAIYVTHRMDYNS